MKKIHILWLDGYEMTFDLLEGSTVRLETAYIYLVDKNSGEKYIPMCNIRHFGYLD